MEYTARSAERRLPSPFDEEFFEVLATQSGSTGLVVGQPGDPQTYGVTLRVNF
ncbi:MAG: hypothetical protein ACXWUX_05690 [Allosphingosinicella sp.]